MRTLLHTLLLVTLTSATVFAANGFERKAWPDDLPDPKISGPVLTPFLLGGEPSQERRVVAIFYRIASKRFLCSGLWISSRYILTAAHCACGDDYRVTNDQVANDLSNWHPADVQSLFSRGPCDLDRAQGDDLALLKLNRPLAAQETGVSPPCPGYTLFPDIAFANRWTVATPSAFTVAGYGYDGDIPGSAGFRRQTSIQVTGLRAMFCLGPIYPRLGCAGMREFVLSEYRTGLPNKDSCAGDSGGPVFLNLKGKFIPVGVVSRGLPLQQIAPSLGQCGSGGIYTLLGRNDVKQWLARFIPQTGNCGRKSPIE